MTEKLPWYEKKFYVILFLFIFFPVGLYGMWRNKSFSTKAKYIWIAIWMGLMIIGFFTEAPEDTTSITPKTSTQPLTASPSPIKKEVDLSQAKPYVVMDNEDFSFPGRNRYAWSITAPQAKTYDERAQTAMKAAMDLQAQRNCHVANVLLEISERLKGQGFPLAIADYAPDGYGYTGKDGGHDWTWRVEASGDDVSLMQGDYHISRKKYDPNNRQRQASTQPKDQPAATGEYTIQISVE